MKNLDITAVEKIIREVAAAEIMPRFRNLAAGDVVMKGVGDPVTIADQEAERRLSERLTAFLPGSLVLGEESFAKDKSVLSYIDSDKPVWVIDPIDGTRNFVAGYPEFAVLLGLVIKHKAVAGWIHDPNSGDTVMGEAGAGVWLRGKQLKLAANDAALRVVGLVGARVKKLISDPRLMPRAAELPPIEMGSCCGFDYPRLFTGDATFADSKASRAGFLFYRHTNPWDHVPGLFLHHEAGGYSADWEGQPYDMNKHRSGLLCAKDKDEWAQMHRLFEPLMRDIATMQEVDKAPPSSIAWIGETNQGG